MNTVMVIAPHPDDETLGCGGTLLRHKANGDEVHWVILTNISEDSDWPETQVMNRQAEIEQVAEAYGFNSVHKFDFQTTRLDCVGTSELVGRISSAIQGVQPTVLYLNNRSDIHTDHQVAFRAAMSAAKSFRHPYIRRILMYETLSETEFCAPLPEGAFQPNVFVDVSAHMDVKCDIMQIYGTEMMESPLPRSVDAVRSLATYRGGRIGATYAEAFMLVSEFLR